LLAAAPDSVSPVAVTVLPVPTLADAKVALPVVQLTMSPLRTPASVQLVIVALVVPSYALLAALTVVVTVAAVMVAVVVAVGLDSV
jgi:hypothetical protein